MKNRTDEEMIDYLIDCTLATVGDMCWRKRISKSEFERQCSIAQKGIDHLGPDYPFKSRAADIPKGMTAFQYYSQERERILKGE